jgi:hypothetical protein
MDLSSWTKNIYLISFFEIEDASTTNPPLVGIKVSEITY